MRLKIAGAALLALGTLAGSASVAEARDGCGPGFHRGVYGYCRPNWRGPRWGYHGGWRHRHWGWHHRPYGWHRGWHHGWRHAGWHHRWGGHHGWHHGGHRW